MSKKKVEDSLNPNTEIKLSGDAKIDELASQSGDDLKVLIEKNIKWSQIIYEQNKKIKHRITLMAVGSYVRLLIIIVPVILGIIFLPPLFKEVWNQYSQLLFGGADRGLGDAEEIFSQVSGDQMGELLKMIKK
ncbi:MAG: hypothetical protein WC862_05435 [Patescibacteria group bacterium]